MTETNPQEAKHRLIDIEKDDQCNSTVTDLFALSLQLVKHLAEEFANEASTKQCVESFVRRLDQNRKKTTNAYCNAVGSLNEEHQQYVDNQKDRSHNGMPCKTIRAKKKRRCQSPDFFVACHGYANLRIVASRMFLIEVMKGHLLYDYVNENLTQRHIPYDKSLGDRIKGVVVANFVNKTPFSRNDEDPIEWCWQLRKRQELVSDLSLIVPNADQTFAVLRYSLPHYSVLDTLCTALSSGSSKSLDEGGEASLEGCARCGFEVPLAFSKSTVWDQEEKREKYQFYCLYCTPLFNTGSVLLPKIPTSKILAIVKLLNEYSTSRYCGNINGKKTWSLEILSAKRPEKQLCRFSIFQNPPQIIQDTKTELHRYKVRSNHSKEDCQNRLILLDEPTSFFKDIVAELRNTVSQSHDRMHTELIVWRYNEGITVYDGTSCKCCRIFFTYCHTTFLLMSLSSNTSVEKNATWILIPPLLVDGIVDWMKSHDLLGEKLSDDHMKVLIDLFPDVLVYKQMPGEYITVPVGWGYGIYHPEPSLQISFDWIERHTLHLCVLSYIHCWLTVTNSLPTKQRVHLDFMTLAISELVTYKMK